MKYLIIDTECSGALRNKAHPFDYRNKLLLVGLYDGTNHRIFDVDYTGPTTNVTSLLEIKEELKKYDCIVGFNIKFDLHWLRRYGIHWKGMIWDCQLAEFILEKQSEPYPSLETSCLKHNLPLKMNTIAQYLDIGKDVSNIPKPELEAYLEADLTSTGALLKRQQVLIKPYWNLFNLQCQDLLVLQEMEFNGMKYDLATSKICANNSIAEEVEIKTQLRSICSLPCVNWSSNDHLSAILYGGIIKEEVRTKVGIYKSGLKTGQDRFSVQEIHHTLPRLIEPLKGSQLAKEGYWSVREDVLRELRPTGQAKKLIDLVLKLGEIEKLRSTYFEGIPKKFSDNGWEDGIMHGQLNQVVARTGRTSSSNPNMQNIPEKGKACFISRFKD